MTAVTLKEKISLADEGTCKLEARVKELERENRALREECNRIKEDSLSRMSVEEHRTSLEECSRSAKYAWIRVCKIRVYPELLQN